MSADVGRNVTVEFALADENASSGSLVYQRLGMMRGKDISCKWDTVDATADMSPAFTKQNLVTFKMQEFSGDGVAYTDAVYNQKAMKSHVYSPPVGTGYQPKAWLRLTFPDGVIEGPFIVTEFSNAAPHADVVTFSINAMSNGAVTYTPS
jgi:predicted secreted protein